MNRCIPPSISHEKEISGIGNKCPPLFLSSREVAQLSCFGIYSEEKSLPGLEEKCLIEDMAFRQVFEQFSLGCVEIVGAGLAR